MKEQLYYGFEVQSHAGFSGVVNGFAITGLKLVGLNGIYLVVIRCQMGMW